LNELLKALPEPEDLLDEEGLLTPGRTTINPSLL